MGSKDECHPRNSELTQCRTELKMPQEGNNPVIAPISSYYLCVPIAFGQSKMQNATQGTQDVKPVFIVYCLLDVTLVHCFIA